MPAVSCREKEKWRGLTVAWNVWFFNYDFCSKPHIYCIIVFQVTGLQATLRNLESGQKIELPMKKGSACGYIQQNYTFFVGLFLFL